MFMRKCLLVIGLHLGFSAVATELPNTASVTVTDTGTSQSIQSASSPPVVLTINEGERKKLFQEFKKAQGDEERALDHEQRLLYQELQSSQSSKIRDWRNQERKKRHAFFDQHTNPPERKQFLQDYIKRKAALDQEIKDRYVLEKKNQRVKKEQLKQQQKANELQFKAQIDKYQRPDSSLWPKGH